MNNIITCTELFKSYGRATQKVKVLEKINFSLETGKRIIITGESGSGKTTLLSVISGLDEVDSGSIIIDNTDITKINEESRARFRLQNIGFVFQYHYLLHDFSALGNVMLPLIMQGYKKLDAEERAMDLIKKVGLEHRHKHYPMQLSGGECQRTAIARALVHQPQLVLADEPTGALDAKNSAIIRDLLCQLVLDQHTTLLVATHNKEFLSIADIHKHLSDGNFVGESQSQNQAPKTQSATE